MLGFDYELRRRGYAGNSCQIVLDLDAVVDSGVLQQRLTELAGHHPVLRARPARGFRSRWKPTRAMPRVRVHEPSERLKERMFNEPLDVRGGELVRFDLVERTVMFTWSHALMDAKSAEYFLALVGSGQAAGPDAGHDWYAERAVRAGGLRARGRQAWRELDRLEAFKRALPVSLATHRRPKAGAMRYQVVALSMEETARVRVQALAMCGLLGDTNYHLAAALVELDRLHQRCGCASASYVVPVPVGLRPKGTRAPLFSNQITMILHQFFPEQLASMTPAVSAVKARHADCARGDFINAGITLAQLFRRLPLSVYMWIVKNELRGEICSLFFGDTGVVEPLLDSFMGARIESLAHVPAVTVPPGVGVVFYRFREQLRFTVVHAEGVLSEAEAFGFAAGLRERLLNP